MPMHYMSGKRDAFVTLLGTFALNVLDQSSSVPSIAIADAATAFGHKARFTAIGYSINTYSNNTI